MEKATEDSSPASGSRAASGPDAIWGVVYAGSAFFIWGVSPAYWKMLREVPAVEIIAHRVVWSFLFLLVPIFVTHRRREFASAVKSRRTLRILVVTASLVTFNWLIYIWAVNNGFLLQASLGYYINPLVNVLLGMLFLKERLRRPQISAVLIACAGVVYLTVQYGQFPWISLSIAFSFGFYGLIRKAAPVGSLVGLTVETMLLFLPGLLYLVYLDRQGGGTFLHHGLGMDLLLLCTAPATAVPLLLFALGARRIYLATLGLMQYIAPTGMFLLAVLAYREPFSTARVFTFALIWLALAIYSVDSIRMYRRLRSSARNSRQP